MRTLLYIFSYIVLNVLCMSSHAQEIQLAIKRFVSDEAQVTAAGAKYTSIVSTFYNNNQYNATWIGVANANNLKTLLHDLNSADQEGLDQKEYQYDFIHTYLSSGNLKSTFDSARADVLLTDAAIHFYGDVHNGIPLELSYDGLKSQPDFSTVATNLLQCLNSNTLNNFILQMSPMIAAYVTLKQSLDHINSVISKKGFKEVIITTSETNTSNTALLEKLFQLGVLDSVNTKMPDTAVTQKVAEAQALFNLTSDGILRTLTVEALNVPIQRRMEEIKSALNAVRVCYRMQQQKSLIIINIPSADLLVYNKGEVILDSKVIVGMPLNQTPTINSTVTEVVLYPYWMVTNDIATRELLPKIKRNNAFLDQNNFQILNKQGNVMNPDSIDWNSLSVKNFPYIIRQSTGCDNSLGLVKLNFQNPYDVYLHDTPLKNLFLLNKRTLSHGCMRVEKALDLAYLLAKEHKKTIDTIIAKGCLHNQKPIVLPADQPMDVLVMYSTAWFDSTGRFKFFPDVYGKFNRAKAFQSASLKFTTPAPESANDN